MNDLRSQLAPGWSGVNIALTVVLFLFAWPLGLLMIGYIVWGRQLGLDFGRPETLSAFGGRLGNAWRAGSESWRGGTTLSSGTGTPGGGTPNATDRDRVVTSGRDTGGSATSEETLRREREILAGERRAFETERSEWLAGRGAGDSASAGERRASEPLDS